jgi:hypothetical protein
MKRKKKTRRPGATETFSVSVDPSTKKALRALADRDFGGNLSALVTDFAADARRRLAAGRYLERHGLKPPTRADVEAIEAELEAHADAWRNRHKKRTVA